MALARENQLIDAASVYRPSEEEVWRVPDAPSFTLAWPSFGVALDLPKSK